ncbi:MAG: DUF5011 domain-containing protein [Bacteroidetes bacterium]|nr:DUF5011 domain-containing protein [Bacteroidota bacterium]MDA1121752.1 DUF5011 domain-containing protein [Bacteroidota bacterium]
MKFLKYIIIVVPVLLFGCAEDFPSIGPLITYPSIVLGGDALAVINVGDAYTDPGAEAFLGTEPTDITVDGTVDPNTAGIYVINYLASNAEGFEATNSRTVVVLETAPSALDLTGTWSRANGNDNVIVKKADRLYNSDNMGGAFAPGDPDNIKADFVMVSDVFIYIPFQEDVTPTGLTVESVNDGNSRVLSPTSFQWSLNASGVYGTFIRVFNKE